MQINISLLIDSMRGASRFLHRDYSELENLQASSKDTKNFVEKAKGRVAEVMQKSLGKYYKTVVFNIDDINNLNFANGPVALVHPLGGTSNFERALPFFAVVVTILVKKQDLIFAEKVAVNFPVLGDMYYAEKGKGAWVEKSSSNFAGGAFRLRVSGVSKIEDSLLGCHGLQLSLAQKLSLNIRIFGSCSYQAALVSSGKLDCVLFPHNPITAAGFDLLIREAGGLSYIHKDVFIGSNYQLHEKIKQLI